MQISQAFKTPSFQPPDAAGGTPKEGVSGFVTVESFANFAAMSGGITAAWFAMRQLWPPAGGIWFPYACALVWAVISYFISRDGLAKVNGKVPLGTTLQTLFIGFLNALVLAGAVVGTTGAVTRQ